MGNIGHASKGSWLKVIAGACVLALAATAAGGAEVADKEKVLEKARASYYSLHKVGLAEFKCSITPNWEMMLSGMRKTDPKEAERRLKIFQDIHFDLTAHIGVGNITVTHSYGGEEHPELADNFDKIYHGTEQAMSGFYSTWSGFVVTPFLPDPTDHYALEKDHADYRISTHEGGVDVVAIMGRDMMIKHVRVTTKDFDSTILPKFRKVEGGYLLSGYDATYQSGTEDAKGKLHVVVDYQVVDGIQLPRKLSIKAINSDAPFEMEVTFSGCQVTRN